MNEDEKLAVINDIVQLQGGARLQKAGGTGAPDSQGHSTNKKILPIEPWGVGVCRRRTAQRHGCLWSVL